MFTIDRLLLRSFEDNDVDNLVALRNDAQVQRFIMNEPIVVRLAMCNERLKKQAEQCALYSTLTLQETGEFAGQCNIMVQELKNRYGFFGIALHSKFRGAEYGMKKSKFVIEYAFKALGIQ